MIDLSRVEWLATHLSEVAQECAECGMQETGEEIICARWAIIDLLIEVRKLHSRLEIDPSHSVDGIAARNETIRLQDLEIAALREDLQAAKLLAHANGEMFKAERAENEALKHDLDSYMRISKEYLKEIEVWRDEAVAHQAFVDAFNASPNHDTDEEEQAHGQWEAAIEAAAPYKKAAIDVARDSKSNTIP